MRRVRLFLCVLSGGRKIPSYDGFSFSFCCDSGFILRYQLFALEQFPRVHSGDDLAALIRRALEHNQLQLEDGDVLVLAQKIVSKSENRYVSLDEVEPSAEALAWADKIDKDPRLIELILRESVEVVRSRPGLMIVEHRLGYVHANAGIDQSNLESSDDERVLLLPENPDVSARQLKQNFAGEADISVIINDSAGRAWRNGITGFAIGTAGFEPVQDMVGHRDMNGRELQATQIAVADELAAAASFGMGQADEGLPVVLIRGARLRKSASGSEALIRAREQDLFR